MKQRKGLGSILGFNTISGKIIWGFAFIYIFFITSAAISYFTVQRGANKINEFSEIVNPSIDLLDDFELIVTQSQLYTLSWVHELTKIRPEDRESLVKLHLDFLDFKDNLRQLTRKWKGRDLREKVDSVLNDFEALIKYQQNIMEKLGDDYDYSDQTNLFEAEDIFNQKALPLSDQILARLSDIAEAKKQEREQTQAQLLDSFNNLMNITSILGLVLIFVGFLVSWWTRRQIVRPIKYINSVFVKLGTGELPEDRKFPFSRDEIGEMAESADRLVFSLKETSRFAENIGKGNYQASYTPLSEKDVLGNALIEMRDNLAAVAEEDRRRSWSTEGLVLFSELLKEHNNDIEKLGDTIISNLVKYLEANQGGLFIVENNEPDTMSNGEEAYMKLASCYAWDKKKYLERKIYPGDGLAGQSWQEQATIFLTEVPDGYVEITSGLGQANPNSILIVPLKLNEEIYGVIEMASFKHFLPFEIEFVEKIAESIASTIATVRINERTKRLLDESTLMTEQMKSQEEEMRQNMEELQSTQEHIERSQKEVKAKEELFSFSNMIIETDRRFTVRAFNDLAEAKLGYDNLELDGLSVDHLFDRFQDVDEIKERLQQGNKWVGFIYIKTNQGEKLFVKTTASAIKDETGAFHKYLFLFDDITHASS